LEGSPKTPAVASGLQTAQRTGESLRKKVQRFDENFLFMVLAAALVPIGVGLLTLQGLIKFAPNTPLKLGIGLSLLAWFIVVIPAATWLWTRFNNNRKDYLGYYGERAVGEQLGSLFSRGYRVFHDVPAVGSKPFNLDHVTIGKTGVAVIETKTRRKRRPQNGREGHKVFYDGKQLIWPRGENRDALVQVLDASDWLMEWLNQRTGLELSVKPVLVIPGWWVEQKARGPVSVVDLKHVGEAVVGYGEEVLTPKQIELIAKLMEDRCRDVED
jgi:hypothetical protein